jgi:hypothetical protein
MSMCRVSIDCRVCRVCCDCRGCRDCCLFCRLRQRPLQLSMWPCVECVRNARWAFVMRDPGCTRFVYGLRDINLPRRCGSVVFTLAWCAPCVYWFIAGRVSWARCCSGDAPVLVTTLDEKRVCCRFCGLMVAGAFLGVLALDALGHRNTELQFGIAPSGSRFACLAVRAGNAGPRIGQKAGGPIYFLAKGASSSFMLCSLSPLSFAISRVAACPAQPREIWQQSPDALSCRHLTHGA